MLPNNKVCIRDIEQASNIEINKQSDGIITLALLGIIIICYKFFSIPTNLNNIYFLSLLWYVFGIFGIQKVRVFSGLGLYVIYMFCFVQIGVLMQELFYSFADEVIIIVALYNFLSPLLLKILSCFERKTSGTLRRISVSKNWVNIVLITGIVSILAFYFSVGCIPILANDAENFRVEAIAGRGFLVIIAKTCFNVSIMLMSSKKKRMICVTVGAILLLGTGYRSQTLELILIFFITYWIGSGRKYLLQVSLLLLVLCLLYCLFGVFRSGIDWSWRTIYKPMVWRFYVNTNNFNTIYVNYPISELQYGKTILNDILVILPGAQTTFMMQLKEIIGFNFDGGSLTPSVFGEGYYNWGLLGAIVWPLFVFMLVKLMDDYHKKHIDGRIYFVLSFVLGGLSTTSFIPVMINSYIPTFLLYYFLIYMTKRFRVELC